MSEFARGISAIQEALDALTFVTCPKCCGGGYESYVPKQIGCSQCGGAGRVRMGIAEQISLALSTRPPADPPPATITTIPAPPGLLEAGAKVMADVAHKQATEAAEAILKVPHCCSQDAVNLANAYMALKPTFSPPATVREAAEAVVVAWDDEPLQGSVALAAAIRVLKSALISQKGGEQ